MDSQDHNKKNGSSEHDNHGVYVCHKCGWPFPKPHPSAKHRRAHKKVCGTIEGYKLIESDASHPHLAVSDDEHASDEDHRTPSPTIEKRSVKELVSCGGVGEKSNASEDEVFTDAVTEFSDSGVSPGMEERIRELNKDVEKLLKPDLNEGQFLKVDATADTSLPLNDTKESSREVLEIAKSEDGKSSNSTRSEEFPVGSSGTVGSQFDSSPVKSETPTDVLIDEINAKVDKGIEQEPDVNGNEDVDIYKALTDSVEDPHVKAARDESKWEFNLEETGKQTSDALTQESLMHKVEQERESELEETKGESSNVVTPESVVQEPVTTDYKLPMGDGQTSALSSTNGIVEQKKDDNDELEANIVKNDVSPLVKPLEDMEDSVAQDIDGTGYSKIVEVHGWRGEGKDEMQGSNSKMDQEGLRVSDLKEQKEEETVCYLSEAQKDDMHIHGATNQKEATNCNSREKGKQNMHSFPVPNSLPEIDNVESIIEGFKDYNTSKSTLPLDLGSAEVITLVQDDNKATIAQEGHSGFQSGDPSGSIESSSADLNALKHGLNEKGVEKSIEGKDDISELIVGSGEDRRSCGLKAPSDAPTFVSSEVFHPHSIHSESSQKAHSEDATVEQSDIKSAIFAEEVKQTTNLREGENADNNEMNKSEKCVTARNESSKEALEDELSANKKTIQEHADSSFISEDNQPIGSLKADGNQDHERTTVELLDIARGESTEVGSGENLVKNTEVAHESAGQSPKSTDVDSDPDKMVNGKGNMEQICHGLQRRADESSQEASQGFGTGNTTHVVESFDFTAKDLEVNHDGSLLVSNENPEDSTSKDAAPLHVESDLLNKSSATVEVRHTREAVKDASDCNFEPSQDEGDKKFENQHDGVSAIDTSVASSSRADSLEGNWGSVSVVSTQSDTTATADVGGLPFPVSQPPGKSEANLQMPKNTTNDCHPEMSDVFEPPSFMMLVESGDCVSQKAAQEIQTAQNIQQPKPEDLQAGWFPSLSNVVNESEGKKKDEEIIDKVSNGSTRKEHSPLKNLLGEAKSPSSKQVPPATQSDAPVTKSNGAAVTTVNAILRSEEPNDHAGNKEMDKEWNSPARYPSEIKKEKRKGKPYWVPFVCCSSVHRDF